VCHAGCAELGFVPGHWSRHDTMALFCAGPAKKHAMVPNRSGQLEAH
jgi:hypothetical protein